MAKKIKTVEEAGKDFIENSMKFSFNSLETRTQANRMLKCIEFGAKYQAERMYSEEEAIKKIIDYVDFQFNANGELDSEIKKWFNAFKKK